MPLLTTPLPLCIGDTVAVTAASGQSNAEALARGVKMLESFGLRVQVMPSCHATHGTYLSGTDETRLQDLHAAFADPCIRGILFARGGYGAARLLPHLDYDLIVANPKIVVGYSDVTALHIVLNQRCNLATYHGPMVASCLGSTQLRIATIKSLWDALFGNKRFLDQSRMEIIHPGRATGLLVGGNLTVIASLLGTPYEINTRQRILFLEEVDEEPYRVDRLLLQLKLAGKFADAAGIAFGDFSPETLSTLKLAIDELVVPEKKPTIWGFPCGHVSPNYTLPLGQEVTLQV